jgi:hypothetical protein
MKTAFGSLLVTVLLLSGCAPASTNHAAAPASEAQSRPSSAQTAQTSQKPTVTPSSAAVSAPPTTAPKPIAAKHPKAGTALAAVARLTVKGRAPKTGYTRAQFGQSWYDTDRNGCDTRNDILRRDLGSRQMKNACKVLAGTLAPDPYTGTSIRFVYGGASEVDIDHVVALSDAWQKGAARWVAGKRLALANDPLNLLAVDSSTNRSKGDGDAATWLPPNKSYRASGGTNPPGSHTMFCPACVETCLWVGRQPHQGGAGALCGGGDGEPVPPVLPRWRVSRADDRDHRIHRQGRVVAVVEHGGPLACGQGGVYTCQHGSGIRLTRSRRR